jgi:LCP family protein required for cell wall assembly
MQNRPASIARRPIRKRKAARVAWRVFIMLFFVFAIGASTGVGFLCFRSPIVRGMISDSWSGKWQPATAFAGKNEITVMILGRDVDRDRRGQVVRTNGRTDAIMVARLDFENKTANVLSIPRDTRVRIPGYRGHHKINAAHAFGGPELTARTIQSFLGVTPEQYVVVDYDSFERALDDLGGLTINVSKQMDYDDNWGNLHIHLKPGVQAVAGKQALGFVRFRKSNDGVGDSDQNRIARQQQFVVALKQKMLSPTTFFRLPNVLQTVRSGVNTSMTDAQLMCIAQFVKGLPSSSVHMVTLPSHEGRSYVTAEDTEARDLVRRMFN